MPICNKTLFYQCPSCHRTGGWWLTHPAVTGRTLLPSASSQPSPQPAHYRFIFLLHPTFSVVQPFLVQSTFALHFLISCALLRCNGSIIFLFVQSIFHIKALITGSKRVLGKECIDHRVLEFRMACYRNNETSAYALMVLLCRL